MKAKLVKESLSDTELEEATEEARQISIEEDCVQHVNEISPGVYRVEDWYDSEQTVISFESGDQLH